MEYSQENLRQDLDDTSELEDELIKLAFCDSRQLDQFLKKYSDHTSELEQNIKTHLGYTVCSDMSDIQDLLMPKEMDKNLLTAVKHMEALQVMVDRRRHISLCAPDPPDAVLSAQMTQDLDALVMFTRELSELVSKFEDRGPHKPHEDQRIDPDLNDPEVIVQHRIACIRRLLWKNRDEFMELLGKNPEAKEAKEAKATLETLLEEKSDHFSFLNREIGWSNRVYVALIRKILTALVPTALNLINGRAKDLEPFATPPDSGAESKKVAELEKVVEKNVGKGC